MKRRVPILALVSLLGLAACVADRPDTPEKDATVRAVDLDLSWLAGRRVFEPQFLLSEQGALLLVWREEGEEGSDIYIAKRGEESRFGEPVRVNDEAGTVESYAHDEMRAAVAVGPAGRVGVAWADSRGQVRAVISMDGGASFAPSIRLEQSEASAYRGFPAVAFDDAGVLHAVWIDSRFAAAGAEEPADLYYARVEAGVATESNLTAEQEPTVCGCCRTYLEATDQGVTRALFRNASQDGYRDIFTVSAAPGADMSAPARIGQPLWKIQGCPMSGPIAAAGRVLWPDGSTGRKLLMEAGFGSDPAKPVFSEEQRGEWTARLSPRLVVSNQERALLLLPGLPASRLISPADNGDGWRIRADDLPEWATSALSEDGSLLLIGAVSGELKIARQVLDS